MFKEQVLPAAKEMDGFRGAYLLADRNTGRTISITLWQSEEALRKSAEAANQLRAQAASDVAAKEPPVVELYEVVLSP